MGRAGRAYRKVRSTFTDRPTNFGWVLEGILAASGLPSSPGQVRWLKEHGITSILTLTETPLPPRFFDGTGVNSTHIQMFDHAPPTQESLSKAVRHLRNEIEKGNVVLVHCLAGQGRTGSVLASYLVEYHGKKAKEAIDHLRKTRPGSVEPAQEAAVLEYARTLTESKNKPQ